MSQITFKNILQSLQESNLRRIRERALAANALAKRLSGTERRKMYSVKHKSGARAVELGAAKFSEVMLGGQEVYCGVSFSDAIGGGRIHLPLDGRVSHTARTILLTQAGRMIGPRTREKLADLTWSNDLPALSRQSLSVSAGLS